MNQPSSLTDAKRVEALLRSLNRQTKGPGAQSRPPTRRDMSSAARSAIPVADASNGSADTASPVARDRRLTPAQPLSLPPGPSTILSPEGSTDGDSRSQAIRELLATTELDLGAGLQSRLTALVGRLVRTLGGVDGFVADESGLPMAGPASCEDAAARSSLAWGFVAGRTAATKPDFVVFSQSEDPVVMAFLVSSDLGPITVGIRSRTLIDSELIETARTALAQAFPVP